MSVVGFLTRTVADTALLMQVGAEDDSLAAAAEASPGRLRVARSLKPGFPARVDGAVRRAVDDVTAVLRTLGHEVEDDDPPYPQVSPAIVRYLAGVARDVERAERPERLQRRTRGFGRLGGAFPSVVLDWALREDGWRRMSPFFERHDVLLLPAAARPPVRAGEWEGLGALRTFAGEALAYPFTAEWNLTGQPSLALPGGASDDGLPIGVQLVGRHGQEATLLTLAAQLEAELGWPDRRPSLQPSPG